MAMKLPGGEPQVLLRGVYARYASSGHLLVLTADGKLLAVPFDAGKLALTGPPVGPDGRGARPARSRWTWRCPPPARWSTCPVARPFRARFLGQPGRLGGRGGLDLGSSGAVQLVALSPDGKALAVGLIRGASNDIWVKQLPRGPFSRVTFGDSLHARASWSADGRSVVYLADRSGGNGGLRPRHRADGTGASGCCSSLFNFGSVLESRDGRWLVLRRVVSEPGNGDIFAVKTGDTDPGAAHRRPALGRPAPPCRPMAAGWRTPRTSPGPPSLRPAVSRRGLRALAGVVQRRHCLDLGATAVASCSTVGAASDRQRGGPPRRHV